MNIFSEFSTPLAGGLLIAAVCSALGVFVVLRRSVFIGATLSQVAACGVALSLFTGIHPFIGAAALTLAAVTLLSSPAGGERVPKDAVLAVIYVLSASAGVLLVSKSAFGLEAIESLLYGDLIMTSRDDLKILLAALLPSGLLFLIFLRPVLYTFLDRDGASVLGIRVRFWELFFCYLLGISVAAASKLGGMLLVFCHLTVPPVAALLLTNRLHRAMALSVFMACASTILGFYISYEADLPVNQTIAVTACILLGISIFIIKIIHIFYIDRRTVLK